MRYKTSIKAASLRQGWQEVPRKRTSVSAEYAEQPGADGLGLWADQQAPSPKTKLYPCKSAYNAPNNGLAILIH